MDAAAAVATTRLRMDIGPPVSMRFVVLDHSWWSAERAIVNTDAAMV
jgi:hypothetical protein